MTIKEAIDQFSAQAHAIITPYSGLIILELVLFLIFIWLPFSVSFLGSKVSKKEWILMLTGFIVFTFLNIVETFNI